VPIGNDLWGGSIIVEKTLPEMKEEEVQVKEGEKRGTDHAETTEVE